MSTTLSKTAAVERARREHPDAELQASTTLFANINAGKDVWWYDIPLRKIAGNCYEFLDFLAFDHRTCELHYLHIPVEFFRTNLSKLVIRSDKETISLELSARGSELFQDVRPTGGKVHFSQFNAG